MSYLSPWCLLVGLVGDETPVRRDHAEALVRRRVNRAFGSIGSALADWHNAQPMTADVVFVRHQPAAIRGHRRWHQAHTKRDTLFAAEFQSGLATAGRHRIDLWQRAPPRGVEHATAVGRPDGPGILAGKSGHPVHHLAFEVPDPDVAAAVDAPERRRTAVGRDSDLAVRTRFDRERLFFASTGHPYRAKQVRRRLSRASIDEQPILRHVEAGGAGGFCLAEAGGHWPCFTRHFQPLQVEGRGP